LHKVTFNTNDESSNTIIKYIENKKNIGLLPIPTRDNYIFEGWFTSNIGGKLINTSTIITSDTIYYARWTKINKDIRLMSQNINNSLKTFFGLNRNCTIITKDNKILKYSALTKTITFVSDYNPTEFL
jgi:uncharacterized repeat protein (TIGR02543 family)